jgi:hypothetical protein
VLCSDHISSAAQTDSFLRQDKLPHCRCPGTDANESAIHAIWLMLCNNDLHYFTVKSVSRSLLGMCLRANGTSRLRYESGRIIAFMGESFTKTTSSLASVVVFEVW